MTHHSRSLVLQGGARAGRDGDGHCTTTAEREIVRDVKVEEKPRVFHAVNREEKDDAAGTSASSSSAAP